MGSRMTTLSIGLVRAVGVAAALVFVAVLIVNRSQAAFTATTSNNSNSFSAGTVVLSDDDSGSTLFSASNLTPGSPVVACIQVTYSGSITPASARLYGTTTGTLDTYLDTTIEVGTGGTFADCTGFTPSSTLFNGTLANFAATHTNWGTGLAAFAAAANPTVRTFRFTVDVQSDNAAQGLSSTANFTFEAQS